MNQLQPISGRPSYRAPFGTDDDGVMSQGQQYPVHQNEVVQANAGLGSRQYNPAAYPMAPFGSSPDGLGAYSRRAIAQPGSVNTGVFGAMLSGSPLIAGMRAVSGLGDATAATTAAAPGTAAAAAVAGASAIVIAAALLGITLSAVGGYYVGKAVAPSHDRESKYAWWGVAAALLGGPVGLGIESLIALNHKGH